MLEGNYWKRRIEVVMREYHKWRIYYKKRVSGSAHDAACPMVVPVVGQDISIPSMEPWLTGSRMWTALASMGGCWHCPGGVEFNGDPTPCCLQCSVCPG